MKILVFYMRIFNLILGGSSKSNFWQNFNWVTQGNLIDFEIEKNNVLNLLIGSASKSNFWQYFNCVIKEMYLILKSKMIVPHLPGEGC